MEHYVGIDVSLELSSLCVLDPTGKVIREAKVASEPAALVTFLRGLDLMIVRVGLEAGPLSQWLYDGLLEANLSPVLLETRHVKAALSAMAIKTDRRDARGIAQLLRMGWYRPVHRKSVPSQEIRALLAARKQMQIKAMDLEQTMRGLLRGFGLKVGEVSRGKLAARLRELVAGHAMLERIVEPMLAAREALWREFVKLHREVLTIVKEDEVCRRLMTVPGVGAVVSLTYRSGVDDPARFVKSKSVGAFFGLTPKRYQSGEIDVSGGITKVGDAAVRTALHDAANVLLSRATRFSTLKRWAMEVAKRRGMRRAKVALARKLATVLHRMWADGTDFVWGKDPAVAAAV
ncbi:IS110 family transposase (plasmid) [Lichenicola cladoniae]|uniref:IS110 family transposase n=1 Tax=Lichenicola cladoniae TaxID=1484109 RepID=A0A6M8HXX7_9PROT|nr:IS110 family transposase [Lichenicola cladoniae]NPD70309.1 IS110 family transposase [Acetobacteraceae bacterium]QKE92951.1 IS110 family transposase [Lichenicola cladoniae]